MMKTDGISKIQFSGFFRRNSVCIKFPKKSKIYFKIAPSQNQLCQMIFDDHQACAEIKTAGTDRFATFETVLGKVTYIFCSHGDGFKIGPGTSQKKFEWE